jgi:hypothetical protein
LKPKYLLAILLGFFSILSCEKDPDPEYQGDRFYFNSFESVSDTKGWYGINTENIVEDAPPSGGKKSLRVSGGCVIPQAYYRIEPLEEECSFVLKLWGKNLSNGGSVSLSLEDEPAYISISVSELSWNKLISKDTLHCTPGSSLILEFVSGGLIGSSMLVDIIEITKVNP